MTEKQILNVQKVMGLITLVLTAIYIAMSEDITASLITLPLGLGLLCTKKIIIQVDEIDEEDEEEP